MTTDPRRCARRVAGRHSLATRPVCAPLANPALEVLSISPTVEDHTFVRRSVSGLHCRIETADSCDGALQRLDGGRISIVVCERELPDGSWRDILAHLGSSPERPFLIVTSKQADARLWSEVLNTGGYDVLAKPFDARETRHVMEMACLRRRDRNGVASGA